MRQIRRRALTGMLFLASLCVFATSGIAGTQSGTVTSILVRESDGLVYFFMSGTATERPPCATGTYWMIKDEQSTAGKQQLAQLLTAYATGRPLTVYGTNTCLRWVNGEDVNTIQLQ